MIKRNSWDIIAGPCAAESKDQILQCASYLSKNKVGVFRAGLWKPRTQPDAWAGVGEAGISWMESTRKLYGIAIATEVIDEYSLSALLHYKFDYVWIGTRNSQSYSLLESVGRKTKGTKTRVILKRGQGCDLNEWFGAAKYITQHNKNVILCERGISGFPRETRNVLDLQTAKLAQIKSGLPVIVDVSHAAGRRDLIIPMALAVKAAGLDGLMVEVHPNPDKAKTDSKQQINFKEFGELQLKLALIPR